VLIVWWLVMLLLIERHSGGQIMWLGRWEQRDRTAQKDNSPWN